MSEASTKAARRKAGWIRRADPTAQSVPAPIRNPSIECPVPTAVDDISQPWMTRPDGTAGDVWRCPDCGHLWHIVGAVGHREADWERVPLGLRLLHWAGWWPA